MGSSNFITGFGQEYDYWVLRPLGLELVITGFMSGVLLGLSCLLLGPIQFLGGTKGLAPRIRVGLQLVVYIRIGQKH